MWNDFKYLSFLATFYFSTVQINIKLCLQICLNLYATRRRVALALSVADALDVWHVLRSHVE